MGGQSAGEEILIIDDDNSFRRTLAKILQSQGYKTRDAASPKSGIDEAGKKAPDLIIVDFVLPGLDGSQLCQYFKMRPETAGIPILILTGNDEDGREVACLDMGADDYLTKPADQALLLAHCRALLRRSEPPASTRGQTLRVGALELDYPRKSVRLDGKEFLHLTPKEFELLFFLAHQSPEPVTRGELYQEVWGAQAASEGMLKTIDVHVRRVRLKLNWPSDRWLITVSGRGYALAAPAK